MSDTLLHCFQCDAFTEQQGEELICSSCGSDFVEIVQVERSPGSHLGGNQGGANSGEASRGPGLQSMLTSLLTTILPASVTTGSSQAHSDRHAEDDTSAAGERSAPSAPAPAQDFFSQLFGQFPSSDSTRASSGSPSQSNQSRPTRSTFTFAFGSAGGGPPQFYSSQTSGDARDPGHMPLPFPFGGPLPQGETHRVQTPIDLANLISQALGAVPGTSVGDYASGEAFDNIISELMNRNPQSNVHAATDRAMSQITRIHLQKDAGGESDVLIGEECSICQEEYKEQEVLVDLECHHIYHEECLLSWAKTNGLCPICRAPMQEKSETVEQDELD